MAKSKFSEINAKAAAITGAAAGLLVWLFGTGAGFGGAPMYGDMSSMMGYYAAGYAGFAASYFIIMMAAGAIAGAAIAWVYNWALRLK